MVLTRAQAKRLVQITPPFQSVPPTVPTVPTVPTPSVNTRGAFLVDASGVVYITLAERTVTAPWCTEPEVPSSKKIIPFTSNLRFAADIIQQIRRTENTIGGYEHSLVRLKCLQVLSVYLSTGYLREIGDRQYLHPDRFSGIFMQCFGTDAYEWAVVYFSDLFAKAQVRQPKPAPKRSVAGRRRMYNPFCRRS